MDISTKIEFVLSCHIIPSEKIGLITLIIADKPLTTAELNNTNNCYKTFDNYQKLFKDHIDSGLVKLVKMKDYNGIMRTHFEVDNAILEDLIKEI